MITGLLGGPDSRLANIVLGYTLSIGGIWTEPAHSNTWIEISRMPVWTPTGYPLVWTPPKMSTLIKRAAESRIYQMDFSQFPEIVGGASVASVTSFVATPSGLTIGTASVNGTKAQAAISGGTDGTTYQIVVTVTDNNSPADTLVGIGYLYVDDR